MFSKIKERVVKRLQGWKEKFLLKAGCEVLIKAIAQAIPTYSMNCFLLPKSWCNDVDGLRAKYWWGQTKNERKIHWVKWDKLCRRKFEGGLGFKNFHLFNFALLAKQGWQLLQAPKSLCCHIFKAKYFPHAPFFILLWVLIPLIFGEAFWRVGRFWSIGLCGSQVSQVLLVLFGMLPPWARTLCSRDILAWK